MLFSAKPKGFFVEQNDHTVFLARTSAPVAPMVIEDVRECPAGDAIAMAEAIKQLQLKNHQPVTCMPVVVYMRLAGLCGG
jgi:hypothetical protein